MLRYQHSEKVNTDFFRNSEKCQNRSLIGPKIEVPEKSISLVTRCMNRLHDLKITLPKNIEDNKNYKNLEFVILDYNSSDGLGKWIKSEMIEHVDSGRLVYYRTEEPKNFHPNHSQNVTFKLAQNELVANIDSDNFTHQGYAERLNQCASVAKEKMLIVPQNFLVPGSKRLFLKGRFAMLKTDIEHLGGFDEDLDEGFGNDDLNFVLRAMLDGFVIVRYESHYADGRLETTNEQRVKYVKNKDYKSVRDRNGQITFEKLTRSVITVNRNRHWGKAKLIKNFSEEIIT